ncbi:LysR family transcriptional regulator [Nocardia sp. NBC_01327]|uniref:LysR family transcriptional regulator n=1 Tax=Nocardia sp. NBC_01327 TaxID=2903593 RepID=UPI002E0DC041|nr:LysR family transcriptional regulator [Nocardia sp. NBC_01327]
MAEFTVTGLRVVREAARGGSFTRAAERLGYTQSAVSRQITLMEQAAGQALFERGSRGVRPTDACRIVLRHADAVLEALDAAREELRTPLPPSRIRVGAFSTATAALVPRAIVAATARYPGLQVRLREGTTPALLSALTRNRIDLAVLSGSDELPEGLESAPLLQDSLYIAVHPAHRLAASAAVPPSALRGERWIIGSADPRTTLLGAWADPAWEPHIAHVARDWVAKLGLVAAGLGITVVPGLAVPALPPTVSLVRIDDPAAVRPTVLVHRRTGPAADHPFAEALRDSAAELGAELRHRLRP